MSKVEAGSSDDGYGFAGAKTIIDEHGWRQRAPVSDRECISCLLYTSPSPRDLSTSRMPSSA